MNMHWDNKLVLFLVFTIVCEVRSRLMSHFVKNREDEVGVECSCCFKFRKLFLKNAPWKKQGIICISIGRQIFGCLLVGLVKMMCKMSDTTLFAGVDLRQIDYENFENLALIQVVWMICFSTSTTYLKQELPKMLVNGAHFN